MIQHPLADPKNTTSMAHDRLDDQYVFSCFFHSQKGGKKAGQNSPPLRQLDSCQQSVWHLQVETPGVGQTPVAEPWWHTSLHLERPLENYGIMHHWKPNPSMMRIHLAPTIFKTISRLTQTTHANTTWCPCQTKTQKSSVFACQQKIWRTQFEKSNGQTEKSNSKFPATRDECVSLRCPYTS